jgi:hypothetical protein
MSLYHVEIYDKTEFEEKYSDMLKSLDEFLLSHNINRGQWIFSQFLIWSIGDPAELHYYNKDNEDESFSVEITQNDDEVYEFELEGPNLD